MTNADMVAAIIASTREVFSMMLGIEVEPGEPFVGEKAATESGVLALVGLAGAWVGTGSMSCSTALGCHLAGQMLMTECPGINDEVMDALAEIANMVIGNVKTQLEGSLGSMALSTPTVIYGHNFETRRVGSREWVAVPFRCHDETVNVQLCLAEAQSGATFRPGFALPHAVQI
jgi:chemotaxis protein CheX